MHKIAISAGLALLLAGCAVDRVNYESEKPSPLYGERGCPGSATSMAGGPATPYDCLPGGRESSGGPSRNR